MRKRRKQKETNGEGSPALWGVGGMLIPFAWSPGYTIPDHTAVFVVMAVSVAAAVLFALIYRIRYGKKQEGGVLL